MISNKIKELAAAKTRLAHLEKEVAAHLRKELAGLPAAYGFGSIQAFTRAVTDAFSGHRAGRGRPAKAKQAGAKTGRRRRAVITDATRANVKKLTEAKKTGAEIAKELRISLPSVQNIKKALGLVKSRK